MEKSREAWFDFPVYARALPICQMTVHPLVVIALLVLAFFLVPNGGISGLAASIRESAVPVSAHQNGSILDAATVLWLVVGSVFLAIFFVLIRDKGWRGIIDGWKIIGTIVLLFTAILCWNYLTQVSPVTVKIGIGMIAETILFAYIFASFASLVVTYSGRTGAKNYCSYLAMLLYIIGVAFGWYCLVGVGTLVDATPRLLHWTAIVLGAFIAPLLVPRARASIAREIGGEENT